jgi:hypothetical protein
MCRRKAARVETCSQHWIIYMVSVASHAVAEFLRSEYSKHGDGTAAFGHSDRLDDSRSAECHATQRLSAHVKVTCLPGAATGIVYSPAQAYGISWLIRKRPPETRIAVDYRYCAGLLTSVLFYFFQINGRGKAAQSTVLCCYWIRLDGQIPYHTARALSSRVRRVSVATPVAPAS